MPAAAADPESQLDCLPFELHRIRQHRPTVLGWRRAALTAKPHAQAPNGAQALGPICQWPNIMRHQPGHAANQGAATGSDPPKGTDRLKGVNLATRSLTRDGYARRGARRVCMAPIGDPIRLFRSRQRENFAIAG